MARMQPRVIGFDDAPFPRDHRGDVLVVGAVYSGARLEGVLSGRVRRDGRNATRTLAHLVARSRFARGTRLIMLQGIAFAGFNVVDIHELHALLGIPVVTVVRKRPDLQAIRRALLRNVRGGARKWALIERAGVVEQAAGVYVQRAGIGLDAVAAVIEGLAVNGRLPEALRAAHIIAGGIGSGESRHRP